MSGKKIRSKGRKKMTDMKECKRKDQKKDKKEDKRKFIILILMLFHPPAS